MAIRMKFSIDFLWHQYFITIFLLISIHRAEELNQNKFYLLKIIYGRSLQRDINKTFPCAVDQDKR